MAGKSSYHTSMVLLENVAALPAHWRCRIPSSTLADWRRRDVRKIVGFKDNDPIFQEAEFFRTFLNVGALRTSAKALYRVYKFYKTTINGMRGVKRVWKENKPKIVRLVRAIQPAFGLKRACRMARISVSCFHLWKNYPECANSPVGLCRKQHPLQITLKEEGVIRRYASDPEFAGWSLASLWLQILRDGAGAFSLTTLRKYVRILRIIRARICKPRRRIGIRANAPLELLHMDTTVFRVGDCTRLFIHLVVDNFSRAILGWRLMRTNNSKDVMENLFEVCETYDLMRSDVTVFSDDGSENLGYVSDFFSRPGNLMRKLVAQVDIEFSNSMVEAVNKVLKYQFLYPAESRLHTEADLRNALTPIIGRYNNRPQFVLHGLTPREVLGGEIPNPRMFAKQLADAREERKVANNANLCGRC